MTCGDRSSQVGNGDGGWGQGGRQKSLLAAAGEINMRCEVIVSKEEGSAPTMATKMKSDDENMPATTTPALCVCCSKVNYEI